MVAWRRPPMPTLGKYTFLLAAIVTLSCATLSSRAQTGPLTDVPLRPPGPPDTTLTRQQADQGRDAQETPLKLSYGRKSAEWTAAKLASLPHETLKATSERSQTETYSGVPL